MKAIVLLFTKADAGDSEDFPFEALTKVNVTVEGNPNDVYSEGLAKRNMYEEAERFFGVLLEIEKEATSTDLSCHVFVVADGVINYVVENKLQGVEY